VIADGVTGFVVDTVEEAVDAVAGAIVLDRRRCRDAFEARFTADRMARDYVAIYDRLFREASGQPRTLSAGAFADAGSAVQGR
jgi:hypothetical protein